MHRAKLKVNILYFLIDVVLSTISTCLPYFLRYNKLSFVHILSLPVTWRNLNLPAFSAYSLIFLF